MIVFGPILGKHPKSKEYKSISNSNATEHEKDAYKWTGEEKNYTEHVIGTCSEWLLAICFQIYILSFAVELRHAYVHAPKLKLIAFLTNSDSSASTDIFDCCVIPPKIIGRKTVPKPNENIFVQELNRHDHSNLGSTLTTISSDDQSSNNSLNLSPVRLEAVQAKF